MKLKDFISYALGYLVAILLTRQLIVEFNPNDLISWLFLIPIGGFDILLTVHLLQRFKAEKND